MAAVETRGTFTDKLRFGGAQAYPQSVDNSEGLTEALSPRGIQDRQTCCSLVDIAGF